MNPTFMFLLFLIGTLLAIALVASIGSTRVLATTSAKTTCEGCGDKPANLAAKKPAAAAASPPEPMKAPVIRHVRGDIPDQPANLAASGLMISKPDEVAKIVADMKAGERVTVVVKSDSCGWCRRYMSETLLKLKENGDKTLGRVLLVDSSPALKTAFKGVLKKGTESLRGLPHTCIIDREEGHYFVATFPGYSPEDKLGERIAAATKDKQKLTDEELAQDD